MAKLMVSRVVAAVGVFILFLCHGLYTYMLITPQPHFVKHSAEQQCKSRFEYPLYSGGSHPHFQPSDHLLRRLRGYEQLHSICTSNISHDNITSRCKFVVSVPPRGLAGIGNKMMSLVSTFIYALLTDRVMLLSRLENLDKLFCEPFPMSGSWILPHHMEYLPAQRNKKSIRLGNLVDKHISFPRVVYSDLSSIDAADDMAFFSQTHQDTLHARVPWLLISSDQYFLPALYYSFGAELKKLFPLQESTFHLIARYLLHPSNSVWNMATQFYKDYLSQSHVLVGVQIRIHNGFRQLRGDTYADDVFQCLTEQKLLPNANATVALLVTSLNPSVYESLSAKYQGSHVTVHQPSYEGRQKTGNLEHEEKALMEIYLLSFCSILLTSPCSTFGYAAQGLKGLRPWQVLCAPRNSSLPVCSRKSSFEPCYHSFPSQFPKLQLVQQCECGLGFMLRA